MLPTLEIGSLVLPTAGLVYIVGIWVSLTLVERAANALDADAGAIYGVATTALISGFVSARLFFVATHWDAYRQNPLGIIWPLTSGFNWWAALLLGFAGAFFYARARRLQAGVTLDALAPGVVLALMTISLADFLAGPGYGELADLPWSVSLFGISRHPVQLYELLVGLAALLAWRYALSWRTAPGQLFLVTVAVYSAGRLLVDAYRANAWLLSGGYHVLQILSLGVLLISLLLLVRLSPRTQEE
jgi:phosphatidylglycerol:prolipoprotein diacylglycerol transferase